MRILEYLFFKYYNWAIKVGNDDMPATFSLMSITLGISLYCIDVIGAYYFFISPKSVFSKSYKYIFPLIPIISYIVLYFILVFKDKDKQIMEKHQDEWTGKKSLGAVLFPIVAYLAFGIELFIKMLMNRGVL